MTHLAEAAFIDEVNDELHLVAAFKIGDFGLIAGSDQRFETGLDQFGHTAAQDGLFAEEVGFSFFLEGGFDHAGTRPALGIGQRLLGGFAGGVLMDGEHAGNPAAFREGAANQMAGTLGGHHEHIHVLRGFDLAEMDVEAVSEHQRLAGLQVRSDGFAVHAGLMLVGQQDHDHIGGSGSFRGGHGGKAVFLGKSVVGTTGTLTNNHV